MIDVFEFGRPAGDLLSRIVRLSLAGEIYELPVLPIGGNKRWKAQLDARVGALLTALQQADKQKKPLDKVSALFDVIDGQVDQLWDLLYAYDGATTLEGVPYHAPVLPPRETLEETVYEREVIAAVREVWRAANPLVGTSLKAIETSEASTNDSLPPTSSPPRPTAGSRKRSRKN